MTYRLLYVSVRGHRYLAGGPTVHPVDGVPAGAGSTFGDFPAVEHHVRGELRGISAIHQVLVIDTDGTVVRRGHRSGPGGTRDRWTWHTPT